MDDLDQSVDLLNPISLAMFLADPDIYSSSIVQISLPGANSPQQIAGVSTMPPPTVVGLSPIPCAGTPQHIKHITTRTSTPLHHPDVPMTHFLATDFISTPEGAEDHYQQPLSASVLCNMGDFFQNAMEIDTESPPSPHQLSRKHSKMAARPPLKERQQGKPAETYVALIGKALLSSTTGSMTLSQIYDHIMEAYPFYRTTTLAWRNAVRHNLAINNCFVKAGRTEVGRGFYWAIHASYVRPFSNGNFTVVRRKTQKGSQNQVPNQLCCFQSSCNGSTIQSQLKSNTAASISSYNHLQPPSRLRSLRL